MGKWRRVRIRKGVIGGRGIRLTVNSNSATRACWTA